MAGLKVEVGPSGVARATFVTHSLATDYACPIRWKWRATEMQVARPMPGPVPVVHEEGVASQEVEWTRPGCSRGPGDYPLAVKLRERR